MGDRQWEPLQVDSGTEFRDTCLTPVRCSFSNSDLRVTGGLEKNQSLGPTPGESVLIKLLSGEHRQQYLLKASQVILMSCQRELKTTDSKTPGETVGREPGALGGSRH